MPLNDFPQVMTIVIYFVTFSDIMYMYLLRTGFRAGQPKYPARKEFTI